MTRKPDQVTAVAMNRAISEVMIHEILDRLVSHPIRTATAFRAAMTEDVSILAANPMVDFSYHDGKMMKPMDVFQSVMNSVEDAIMEGRMIDFGRVPNSVLKAESLRARAAFEGGDLAHPFADGWVGTMSWEGGFNAYYVKPSPTVLLVFELYGVETTKGPAVMLYDGVAIDVRGPGDTRCTPVPLVSELSRTPLPEGKTRMQFDTERAANALDPLVTMLRFLADASIPVDPVVPPVRLNKARLKRGKAAIPAHTVVHTADYVTTLLHPHQGGHASQGGHHASPVAHFRRSHLRRIAADRVVQVRSSKVNWRSGDEMHRLFYQVKGDGHAPQE